MTLQYKELAKYYDASYHWKDYKKESESVHLLIKKYKKSNGKDLLEVACGTGNHIQYLKKNYNITGIDLNKQMLDIAKKKFKGIEFIKEDMRSFNLKKKFDVIVCLFSSIAYMMNKTELKKTIKNFSKHLADGGVMIIEPFIRPETFEPNHINSFYMKHSDSKFFSVCVSKRRKNIAVLDEHILIADKKGVKYIKDHHELTMFKTNDFLDIMKSEGLKSVYIKNGLMQNRGLFIGIKN